MATLSGARKILIVDDNPDIHRDFASILEVPADTEVVDQLEAEIFGSSNDAQVYQPYHYRLSYATQGVQALEMVLAAVDCRLPFLLAFVDMRMPPGWDGLETIERLWQVDPKLQIVLCTAYSDHAWPMIQHRLGHTESLLILKKPFDVSEVAQMAAALTEKWILSKQAATRQETLADMMEQRTAELKAANRQLKQEICEREQFEKRLESRRRFESLISDIFADFVNLPVDQIDAAIVDAQRRICDHLDIDRSVLWQFTEDASKTMWLSHVHETIKGFLPEGTLEAEKTFPWVLGQVLQGKDVRIDCMEDIPAEANQDRESFRSWGVKSSFIMPLLVEENVVGALSFGTLSQETTWLDSIVQRLHLVAQIFASALNRKQTGERLASLRRFENLVANISAQFVLLPADRIDKEIEDAMRRICENLAVDLSSLWQWSDEDPTLFTITHLHSPPEGPAFPTGIDAQQALPWLFDQTQCGEIVIVSTEDLPSQAARDRETRRQFGVTSSIIIPLATGGGSTVGVLSFDSLKQKHVWPEPIVERLKLIAQIFANALSRKQAEMRLASLRRFENLVANISTHFINLPSDRIDARIEDAQQQICDILDVDLSTLWQWSDNAPHFMTITHLYGPPEGPKRPVGIDAREAFPWTFARLLHGEELVLSTDRLPPEAARDIESRRHYGVKSSVNIPLSAGGGPLIGILTFDTLKVERSWQAPILEKLRLVAQIFANALGRKRSDLQLRESRERLQAATASAEVGLWVMEADTGHVWVTAQTRALFHFAEDENLDYASFDKKIDPADRQRVNDEVQAAIQSGEPLDIEFRIVLPDESVRWIRASGKPMPGSHGQGFRLMGASKDISQRKRMEEKLRGQLDEINDLKQQLEKENILLRKEIELQHVHEEIVCRSRAMKEVLSQVEQVARTDATVLIEGETGTGKELLARAVHRLSDRRDRPLVTVNCASLPPTLVESELFGREKGAYTGALTRMTGRFEMADGATLFLDEVGELPLAVQAKLLRVLEQGSFERLGSAKSIRVDVRIIAATNQDLSRQVDAGKFRKDLFYRLNVFPIRIPPLRERPEAIPQLVWHFVRQYENKMGRRIDHITQDCMDELQRYEWPGNVRELRNMIERALIVCRGRRLAVQPPRGINDKTAPNILNLEETERSHITSVLIQADWRISGPGGAAELLGLKRTTLQSKMKKLGIQRP